jgi:hypothetical protein
LFLFPALDFLAVASEPWFTFYTAEDSGCHNRSLGKLRSSLFLASWLPNSILSGFRRPASAPLLVDRGAA